MAAVLQPMGRTFFTGSKSMKALGIALVVLGIVGLIYGGVSWTYRDKVVDAGPIEITKDKTKSLPVPPIAGAIFLVAGVLVLMRGDKS
jgi:hypothetical protein